ncbi:MAG: dienelactone hydrolase family protein [Lachnospiraceae bacterium]|nr:dienelactone hydrolase family protein [Lachnospiraceae bacterium]
MARFHFLQCIFLALSLFISACPAEAQSLEAIKGKVPDGYNFWLSEPKKDQGVPLKPLVIFLHGASLSGNDLNRVLRYGTLDAIKRGLNLDAYVMAPQTRGAWQPKKVMADLDYVLERHDDIDTTRIYVVGMSLGGYGSIDVANAYPHRIAAALSFCGGGTGKDFSGLSQVPIWIIHGTADRAVPISRSDAVANSLKKISGDSLRLIYDRVPGMNHGQPARFFYVPQFYEWLFRHSLSDPGRPIAEGFKVDNSLTAGIYRKLPGSELITVIDDGANLQQELINSFIPAGFDGDAFEGIIIENEIEAEEMDSSIAKPEDTE